MSWYALLMVTLFHTVLSDGVIKDDDTIGDHDARRFLTKRSVRVCGIKLVDMMKKVCNHCYKTRKHEQRPHELAKRNAAQGSLRAIVAILDDEDPPDDSMDDQGEDDQRLYAVRRGLDALDLFIDKRWGGDTRRPRHQASGGIANKCCLNQCSYSDLVSYCCTTSGP